MEATITALEGHHQCTGGPSSRHERDIISASGGYHLCVRGCSVDLGDLIICVKGHIKRSLQNRKIKFRQPKFHCKETTRCILVS